VDGRQPDGGPQLPDLGRAHALQPRPLPRERQLRVCPQAAEYVGADHPDRQGAAHDLHRRLWCVLFSTGGDICVSVFVSVFVYFVGNVWVYHVD
jgi:hypothetical protein